MVGRKLAHYEIRDRLGEGGMGEVYLAEDTKLQRQVAVKVLPERFTEDAERLVRFQREAKVLAALDHPNIAAIYGIEEVEGRVLLIMQLAEGETLAERIARGPIPVAEALPIALQIAEGVEEAHERGIVHRDLKPANIKVASSGQVKILDFGLAKAIGGDAAMSGSQSSLTQSPTLTAQMTTAGVLMGTAAYMSPEQARGEVADKRADIWAFGVVLTEMLTATKLHDGKTASDVLASVLKEHPRWEELPADTPPALRRLLERCLEKEARDRLRDLGEARIAIRAALADPRAREELPRAADRSWSGPSPWLLGAVGLIAGALLMWFAAPRIGGAAAAAQDAGLRIFPIAAEGRQLIDTQAISPDGTKLAYTTGGQLWIRDLDRREPREIPSATGATLPFWSPDSGFVAYAGNGTLWKVESVRGTPEKICTLPPGFFVGGTWSSEGRIAFSTASGSWSGHVFQVSSEGGDAATWLTPDRENDELRFSFPSFLPDGKSLLLMVHYTDGTFEIATWRNGERKTIVRRDENVNQAHYSDTGHVIFDQGGSFFSSELWAFDFDIETLESSGEPRRIATDANGPSVATNGRLLYSRLHPDLKQLIWVDRSGNVLEEIDEPAEELGHPMVSPDGSRILYSTAFLEGETWIYDIDRGGRTRVTFGGGSSATWSPDGEEIAFVTDAAERGILMGPADGGGAPRNVGTQLGAFAPNITPDGRHLVYYVVEAETMRDLWYRDLQDPESEPVSLLSTPFNEARPTTSMDSRYVAYQSDESGRWEVYVLPFPGGDQRWQVSVDGGALPVWSPKGDELFYIRGDDDVMVVSVDTGASFRAGAARKLFSGADVGTTLLPQFNFLGRYYDVSPDGQRLVLVRGLDQGVGDLILVENALRSDDD